MSDGNSNDTNNVSTAQCGACKAMIPSDSESCPECHVSFSGVQNVDMGECGSCNAIIPIDSKSCPECKISFVLDDLINNMSNWMKKENLSVTDVFGKWDENDDGVLSSTEIRNGLIAAKLAVLPDSEVDRFMHQIDLNNDNDISLGELSALLLLPPESNQDDSDEKSEIKYSDNVLNRVMKKHEIDDTEGFLKFTKEHYDDGNSYLNEKELTEAAVAWNDSINDNDAEDTETEDEVEESESDHENEETDDENTSLDADDSPDDDTTESEHEDDNEESEEVEEEDSSEEEEDSSEEEEEGESEGDDEDDESTDTASDAFKRLYDAVIDSGETAITIFEKLDRNESDNVDPEEFKNAVHEAFDDDFSDDDLSIIINALDSDKDGFIDIIELTGAIEDPDEVVDTISSKKEKEGPAEWQRFLMRHYENLFPIAYVLATIFVGVWVVNGLVGPVDGSGGPIAFDGDETVWIGGIEPVAPGEIYECDKNFQLSKCSNSLTPLAGDNGSSSMPKGFYWDGIMFMIIGIISLIGIFLLQNKTKEWRLTHRKKKQSDDDDESDDDDDDDDESDDDDDDDESDDDDDDDDDDDESDDDDEDDDSDDDDDDDDDDDESDDDDDDDGDDEEDIDVGSHVGVDYEDEEWYGVIVKFDEDDDEVLVKSDEDDEEYWVPFDALFVD